MTIIYDFDGTLTPYSMPQYEILKKCGYDDEKQRDRRNLVINQCGISMYQAYYEVYEDILKENNIAMTAENIILGSDKVEFNKGVLDYFQDLQTKNTGIKHYIVTSGFKEYVSNTKIALFVNGIYGAVYRKENDVYTEIEELVSDGMKPEIIKKILRDSNSKNVIYIGDGMTDRYAFEYVHTIGGTSLYVGSTDKDLDNFSKLKEEGIVDNYFERDYSKDSELRTYIMKKAGILK